MPATVSPPRPNAPPPAGPTRRRPGRLAGFADRYGWRAYALPVLATVTVVVGINLAAGTAPHRSATGAAPHRSATGAAVSTPAPQPAATLPAAPTAAAAPVLPSAATPGNADAPTAAPSGAGAVSAAALPAGGPYPTSGSGTFAIVPGQSALAGHSAPGAHVVRYAVEVERGAGLSGAQFAAVVQHTLADPRSWIGDHRMAVQRVSSGRIDFRVALTSALTVRTVCGYTIHVETSCFNGARGTAYINAARWARGAVAFRGGLAAYREYSINHEVGHALGHGHLGCLRPGALAPAMMEQTLGVGACRPNPWPYAGGRLVTGPPAAGH